MDRITRQDIDELLDEHDSPCVSIYMQTHPTGAEGESDPLRLKTLANEVEKTLLKSARRSVIVRDFLQPIRQLTVDEMFWNNRSTGLVVFRANDLFRAFRVAMELTPAIHIQERFIIRPLLPLAIESDAFFLLTLSQHRVRLFSGNRYGLTLMQVPEMPTRMATLIATDQGRKQMHIGGNDPSRKHSTIYHGHGGKPDSRKDEIEEFLREIDVAVHPILKRSRAPLKSHNIDASADMHRLLRNTLRKTATDCRNRRCIIARGPMHMKLSWKNNGARLRANTTMPSRLAAFRMFEVLCLPLLPVLWMCSSSRPMHLYLEHLTKRVIR